LYVYPRKLKHTLNEKKKEYTYEIYIKKKKKIHTDYIETPTGDILQKNQYFFVLEGIHLGVYGHWQVPKTQP